MVSNVSQLNFDDRYCDQEAIARYLHYKCEKKEKKRDGEKERKKRRDKRTEMHESGYLIAKDLNLTVAPMGWRRVRVRVRRRFLVRVDLDMQRQTLHAFLTREISTETLHRHVYLHRNRTGNSGDRLRAGITLLMFPLKKKKIHAIANAIQFARCDCAAIIEICQERAGVYAYKCLKRGNAN